jgi:hypothetical protein
MTFSAQHAYYYYWEFSDNSHLIYRLYTLNRLAIWPFVQTGNLFKGKKSPTKGVLL